MNANLFVAKDYENKTTLSPPKNKPKQTQWIKRIRGIFRRFLITYLTQPSHINITIPIIRLTKQEFATKIRKNLDSIGICNNGENRQYR